MEITIGLLIILAVWQQITIQRLMDRLLIQARIPALTPVRIAPPTSDIVAIDPRKKLFSVKIDE